MSALLWTLVVLGVWNAVNLFARARCRRMTGRYLGSIALGIWAAFLLAMN